MGIYSTIITLSIALIIGAIGIILFLIPIKKIGKELTNIHRKAGLFDIHKKLHNKLGIQDFKFSIPASQQNPSVTPPPMCETHISDYTQISVIYLIAPIGKYYIGRSLWQTLLNQGLIYGERQIFHAYEKDDVRCPLMFSVANAVEPGYFNHHQVDRVKIPGLCFFMGHQDNPKAHYWQTMLSMAQRLKHLLGGTLCDAERQPLTSSFIQHYQKQLKSAAIQIKHE